MIDGGNLGRTMGGLVRDFHVDRSESINLAQLVAPLVGIS